jgi:hypothetical protein
MFSAPAAVTEKASERCQVGDRKANTSELRSNVESTDDVETGGRCCDAPSRNGAVRSSAEIAVMAGEEGAASSGRHGGSTGEPGGIPHDLQAL